MSELKMRRFRCDPCSVLFIAPADTEKPVRCPHCGLARSVVVDPDERGGYGDLRTAVDRASTLMLSELLANRRKGDRAGWLAVAPMALVLDIYYHVGKLQAAVNDLERQRARLDAEMRSTTSLRGLEHVAWRLAERAVREHAADVANMAMMVADRCGVLGLPPGEPASERAPNTAWTSQVEEKNR